jgi:alpha-aminoadipic semialdehyde synthase
VRHKEGKAFDKADYYANPNNYETRFADDYLEHIHWLINGVYWESKYPRILSIDELR